MAEVTKLIKELFEKFDTLQEDITTLRSVVASTKRRKASVLTAEIALSLGPDLRADLGPRLGVHPPREEGSLGETHLRVAEAAHQVLGEEHMSNLTTRGHLPVLQQ